MPSRSLSGDGEEGAQNKSAPKRNLLLTRAHWLAYGLVIGKREIQDMAETKRNKPSARDQKRLVAALQHRFGASMLPYKFTFVGESPALGAKWKVLDRETGSCVTAWCPSTSKLVVVSERDGAK